MLTMPKIADRLKSVEENIASACQRANRSRDEVKLIVVTKTAPIESIKKVIELGCCELGENRLSHLQQVSGEISEFLRENADSPNIPERVNWHMIGHLQRNKVKKTLQTASLIQSVDTLRLAEEINRTAEKLSITADVLLQINCSQEPQKYGAPVGAAIHLAEQLGTMRNIRTVGLMTMAPLTMNKDIVRACFVRARELFEELKGENITGSPFTELSMGMSQDYEVAVEEGATMLRIGSAIFSG